MLDPQGQSLLQDLIGCEKHDFLLYFHAAFTDLGKENSQLLISAHVSMKIPLQSKGCSFLLGWLLFSS